MPTMHIQFSEEDILELVRENVRTKHKLKKGHPVKVECFIDRDKDEKPTIAIEVAFEEETSSKK